MPGSTVIRPFPYISLTWQRNQARSPSSSEGNGSYRLCLEGSFQTEAVLVSQQMLRHAGNPFLLKCASILVGKFYGLPLIPEVCNLLPSFANTLDGVYVLWYAQLNGTTVDELNTSAAQLLDNDIQPIQTEVGVQFVIAAAYPSMNDAASATVPLTTILKPGNGQGTVNLQAQADIYQALLRAVNDRAWIGGFVSRGFYPPVGLQDTSTSVHSKPAADVLWYWYPRLLGITH